jgi:imidazolonepropionase-like amidohydrolase
MAPRVPAFVLFLGLVAAGATIQTSRIEQQRASRLALVNATIHPSPTAAPIPAGTVLVENDTIAAVGAADVVRVPERTTIVDCSGLAITAGFWNSHVHFFERKWTDAATIPAPEVRRQLEDMLTRYGFSGAFDLGSMLENTQRLRDRIESGEVPGPRILSTGEALLAPNAVPADAVIRALGYMTFVSPQIADAAGAVRAAAAQIEAGADGLKLHLQPPPAPNAPIPQEAMRAAIDVAHRARKPVFVHPARAGDIAVAAAAGADVIAHTTPFSGPWDDTTIGAMKARGVALTPTLTVWPALLRHDRVSVREQAARTAIAQLRAWVAAGGAVLFGSDLGAADYDPADEYAAMAEAGMSFPQILASLTTVPAERFALARTGRVEPGFVADLTAFAGDPLADIRSLAAVRLTVRGGRILYQAPR